MCGICFCFNLYAGRPHAHTCIAALGPIPYIAAHFYNFKNSMRTGVPFTGNKLHHGIEN
jgi:hypothetical protein